MQEKIIIKRHRGPKIFLRANKVIRDVVLDNLKPAQRRPSDEDRQKCSRRRTERPRDIPSILVFESIVIDRDFVAFCARTI